MNPSTMASPVLLTPTIAAAGQGTVLHAFGEEVIIHLDGQRTGGALWLWTEITPPGGGPPPHYHLKEDECFVVQEGRMQFLVEGQWREVSAGGIVFAPRGSVHTFKNIGDRPSRMLVSTSPAGFETFFSRCAEEFGQADGPDMERIVSISAEHGIYFVQNEQKPEERLAR